MIPLEIERKFLINQTDSIDENCSDVIDIEQIYLIKSDPDIQRRVRSMTTNGHTQYFYTEKKFISSCTREENEREIDKTEYEQLLNQRDCELKPIIKTRKILYFDNQRFEIDCYPFSTALATLELEIPNEDYEIILPPFISVIKEVTGDKAYSNANLALNQCFP